MNKKIIATLILMITSLTVTRACDICGCGVGSYYLGILPEYNKRFLGMRYQYKSISTHLGPGGDRTAITEDETYQTAELWGGWNVGTKFRVLAFVPYNFNERKTESTNGSKHGLGDIALMGYYNMLDGQATVGRGLLVQSLWIGAGLKVPTGKYETGEQMDAQESPNNFQLGTASIDFTLNAAYDIRYNDLGLNTNLNYKINTANKFEYRYGNKFTANMLAYYKIRVANAVTVAPNVGVLYETAQKDVLSAKYDIDVSGGYSLSAVAGLEVGMKGLSFGANYQNVAVQNLAGGRAYAGSRLMVHMSLPF